MPEAKYTDEQITDLLKSGISSKQLHIKYGVSKSRIKRLKDELTIEKIEESQLDDHPTPTPTPTPKSKYITPDVNVIDADDQNISKTEYQKWLIDKRFNDYYSLILHFCLRHQFNRHLSGKDRKLLKDLLGSDIGLITRK